MRCGYNVKRLMSRPFSDVCVVSPIMTSCEVNVTCSLKKKTYDVKVTKVKYKGSQRGWNAEISQLLKNKPFTQTVTDSLLCQFSNSQTFSCNSQITHICSLLPRISAYVTTAYTQ